jgi:hypothetical protein
MMEDFEVKIGIQTSPEGEFYINRSDLIDCLQKVVNCDVVEPPPLAKSILMAFCKQLTLFGYPQHREEVGTGCLKFDKPLKGKELRYYYSPDEGVYFSIDDLMQIVDIQEAFIRETNQTNQEWKSGFECVRKLLDRFNNLKEEGQGFDGYTTGVEDD